MTTRERLEAKLAKKESLLDIAYTTYEELLSSANESYRFDSGQGSQRTNKRKISELKDQIDSLESEIDGIIRRLCGRGLTKIVLRRTRC
jgi:hypothetical protein